MVHELEMPFALAGPIVDGDDAFGEEVVAGPEAAVEIGARRLDRQVREAELFVGGNLIPDTGVAGDRPRFVQPRVVAEFAGTRNRVERPQPLSGAHVEPADQPFSVVVGLRRAAFEERRPDHDDAVCGDGGCRMHANLAGDQIDLLPFAEDHAGFQIDDAVGAEGGDARSGARVERDQAVAGRDVENPFVAAVSPVGDATARQLPGRRRRPRAFVLRVDPSQLAGGRVERNDRAACASGRVQHAVDHQRRAFELEFGTRPEAVGLESPRHLERVEIRAGNLRERRIVLILQVAGVRPPVAAARLCRLLSVDTAGGEGDGRNRERGQRRHDSSVHDGTLCTANLRHSTRINLRVKGFANGPFWFRCWVNESVSPSSLYE